MDSRDELGIAQLWPWLRSNHLPHRVSDQESPRFAIIGTPCSELRSRQKKKPLTEDLIKRLHALVEVGPHAKPTSYWDGQNAIRTALPAL